MMIIKKNLMEKLNTSPRPYVTLVVSCIITSMLVRLTVHRYNNIFSFEFYKNRKKSFNTFFLESVCLFKNLLMITFCSVLAKILFLFINRIELGVFFVSTYCF